jgi:hypothetical protein
MKKYRVVASVLTRETWEIEANDEAEARANWEEGDLKRTEGYTIQEILSLTEIPGSVE